MIRVLGVTRLDDSTGLRSRAQRVLIAGLVLDHDSSVSIGRLAELVWGDEQPADPTAALQNHIYRLRRALPEGVRIVSTGPGYRVELSDDVDVTRYLARHRNAIDAVDDHTRLEHIEVALGLWGGEPYADLDDIHARAEQARLTGLHQALHELRADTLIRLGRIDQAVAALEALRVEHPLHERVTELLMRAHVAAGRKPEALDAYQALRTRLIDETGLDPSPELTRLETAVLTDQLIINTEAPDAPPTRQVSLRRAGVPASTFVGRTDELRTIADRLRATRLVTLVGPGGVGKTRLSLHTAAAIADEHVLVVDVVELVQLSPGSQVGEAVAGELGLQPRANVGPAERIVDSAAGRPRLIVLDNCEHVIESVAALVDEITKRSSNVTFLATSREPLNIDGESVIRISPLDPVGEAIELFIDRATALIGTPPSDPAGAELTARICTALDGLPLAIELAAARLSSMTLREVSEGVAEPLALLGRGRRTVDERHRSLRALIEWSVRELDTTQLAVFTATAAFAGPFTTEAMSEVTDLPAPAVSSALADLIDRSLVAADPGPAGRMLFSTLETIRSYAAELLDASPDGPAIRLRRDDWILDLVDGIDRDLQAWARWETRDDGTVHLAELRSAHQRFVAADDADRSLRLIGPLHFVAFHRMHPEMYEWITDIADRFGELEHPAAESVLASASMGAWISGDLDAAADFADRAGRAAQRSTRVGAGRAAAEALADVVQFAGENQRALELFDKAVQLSRDEQNELRVISTLADYGTTAGYLGIVDAATAAFDEARRLLGDEGPSSCRAWVDYAEGEALADHDPERAIVVLDSAIDLAQSAGSTFIVGVAGLTRAGVQIRTDDPLAAIRGLIDLIQHWRRCGALVQQWITMRSVVDLFVRVGEYTDAATVLGAIKSCSTSVEASGADAERLAWAEATIRANVIDFDGYIDEFADGGLDRVVETAIERLGRLADNSPVRPDAATS